MSEIHIECGIQGSEPTLKNSSFLFLPLFKAISIDCVWNPKQNQNFSLIFTSKSAIKIFSSNFLTHFNQHQSTNETYLKSISTVGQATAELAKSIFPNSPVFYPKKGVGLKNLLLEEAGEDLFPTSSIVFIFTALDGKTHRIIEAFENEKNLKFKIIPIYKLEPLPCHFDTIFSKENLKCIFYCRSGQMLEQIVKNLVSYFSVTAPDQLPSFIYFHVWENSATSKMIELNLIDRKIS